MDYSPLQDSKSTARCKMHKLRLRMIGEAYRQARDAVLHTDSFIRKAKKEEGIRKPFRFLAYFTLIAFIFLTYLYVEQVNSAIVALSSMLDIPVVFLLPQTLWFYIAAYFIFIALYMMMSFLRYYIVHIFASLLGARHPYQQTYKAMAYSLAPEYGSTPLFVALVMLLPFIILGKWPFLIILFAVLLIPYIGISAYTCWLRVMMLSKLQDISMARSFLSIYVLGFFGQLISVAVIEAAIIMIVFAYMAI